MNYRHQYHAGNFADVMKHAVLVQLVRALQKKEKGFLYLDTHAGRGTYDLAVATRGESLARKPEWPEGVGRVWAQSTLRSELEEFISIARQFDHDRGNRDALPHFYPGSPSIVRLLARPQDRLALCEKQPDEFASLAAEFCFSPRTTVHQMDGYVALRAMLPPLERRALVLIDPPFEEQDEFAQIVAALKEGLSRLPSGVFAIWYPLTERARIDRFIDELVAIALPPTLALELMIAGETSLVKMRGCGLVIVNPPWQFEEIAAPLMENMTELLAQAPGGGSRVTWIVPER